jgi:hypothetical protein
MIGMILKHKQAHVFRQAQVFLPSLFVHLTPLTFGNPNVYQFRFCRFHTPPPNKIKKAPKKWLPQCAWHLKRLLFGAPVTTSLRTSHRRGAWPQPAIAENSIVFTIIARNFDFLGFFQILKNRRPACSVCLLAPHPY